MPRTKKNSSNISLPKSYLILITVAGVTLLALLTVLYQSAVRQADILGKYELLEHIDNQACRYLGRQPNINGSFDLEADAPKGSPKLTYTCLIGEKTQARTIQGKYIDAYDYGAKVSYFATNEEAIKYAEEKLNPLRYWGVDQDGQKNGIPQTSRFTFIVNDAKRPYFDAYTVKANAVLRVSLPCGDPDVAKDGVACYAEADSMLQRELKGINVL